MADEQDAMSHDEYACLYDTYVVQTGAAYKRQLESRLEEGAASHWNRFYNNNENRFFKDRHWLHNEFPELRPKNLQGKDAVLLEVGCGAGNLVFPQLDAIPTLTCFACDFAPKAVELVEQRRRGNPQYISRLTTFVADLTVTDVFQGRLRDESVDIVTMIFVLSAIHPDKFIAALKNCRKVLKPNGHLLLRDYAKEDHAEVRFKEANKLSDGFYVRKDGTRTVFLTEEALRMAAGAAGMEVNSCENKEATTSNYKEGLEVRRLFLQATLTPRENSTTVNPVESAEPRT